MESKFFLYNERCGTLVLSVPEGRWLSFNIKSDTPLLSYKLYDNYDEYLKDNPYYVYDKTELR